MNRKTYLLIFLLFLLITLTFGYYKVKKMTTIKHNATFKTVFKVNQKMNQQGLAFDNKNYYIGYDIDNNQGIIIKYDKKGTEIKRTTKLPIGHTADLAIYNKEIYIANGGGKNPTKVYRLNFDKYKGIKTYDFTKYGHSALLSIDQTNDDFILHTVKNDKGTHKFFIISKNCKIKHQFTVKNIGVPQGLDYANGNIYFYTNRLISIIILNGEIKKQIEVLAQGESQGISVSGNHLTIGFNNPNRVLNNY